MRVFRRSIFSGFACPARDSDTLATRHFEPPSDGYLLIESGHAGGGRGRTCPGFDVAVLRSLLWQQAQVGANSGGNASTNGGRA
jgi:hypothetical protein